MLDEVVAALVQQIRSFRPDIVVTHDALGQLAGHPDHRRPHHVTRLAVHAEGLACLYRDVGELWQASAVYCATHLESGVGGPGPLLKSVGSMCSQSQNTYATTAIDVTSWLEQKDAALFARRGDREVLVGLVYCGKVVGGRFAPVKELREVSWVGWRRRSSPLLQAKTGAPTVGVPIDGTSTSDQRLFTSAVKAAEPTRRAGPSGILLSRIPTPSKRVPSRLATSTQLLPAPSEYVDFCQVAPADVISGAVGVRISFMWLSLGSVLADNRACPPAGVPKL